MVIQYKHEFALLTNDDACSPKIKGIMRKDESAVILPPEYEQQLKTAHKLRYYKASLKTSDYIIKAYYRDTQRPLTKWLIKPIVVLLTKSVGH